MPTDIVFQRDAAGQEQIVLQGHVVADGITLKAVEFERLTLKAVGSLPQNATPGDVYMVTTTTVGFQGMEFTTTQLYLCVLPEGPAVEGLGPSWREIQLGPVEHHP